MSEEKIESAVKKLLETEIERLKKEIRDAVEAPKRLEEKAEEVETYLKEVARVELPLSVIDVLARGGFVEVGEKECRYWGDIEGLLFHLKSRMIRRSSELPEGKYRVILIVEPVREVVK